MPDRRRGAFRVSAWLVRCALGCPPAIAAVPGVRTVPGAAAHATPGTTWGRVIRGIFFPHSCCRLSRKAPAQQAQGDMVIPAGPSARLVFVQPHVALFGLEFGFNAPSRLAHVSQRVQGSVPRGVGQVVAGFATVQIPPEYGPELLAGLPPPGRPDPLGVETV